MRACNERELNSFIDMVHKNLQIYSINIKLLISNKFLK